MQAPVLWSEGMLLTQQQFQQQNRFTLAQIEAHSAYALQDYQWGFTALVLDETQLKQRRITLKEAAGIFPDGTPFEALSTEWLEVPAGTHSTLIYLALPLPNPQVPSVDAPLSRYCGQMVSIVDETRVAETNAVEADVAVALLKPCLLHEGQDLSQYTVLPVARVAGTEEDLRLEDSFMPPVLWVRALPALQGVITEVLALLQYRLDLLQSERGQASVNQVIDYAQLLLGQVLTRAIDRLTYFSHKPRLAPEVLHGVLRQLVAEVAYIMNVESDLPKFSFLDLATSFHDVMQQLRQLLNVVVARSSVTIPIVDAGNGRFNAAINDRELVDDASFVLAVKADLTDEEVQGMVQSQFKVGPLDQLPALVASQVPGVMLKTLALVPAQVPYHAGFSYFKLDKASDYWSGIRFGGGIGLHIGGVMPGVQLELWAIKGGSL